MPGAGAYTFKGSNSDIEKVLIGKQLPVAKKKKFFFFFFIATDDRIRYEHRHVASEVKNITMKYEDTIGHSYLFSMVVKYSIKCGLYLVV